MARRPPGGARGQAAAGGYQAAVAGVTASGAVLALSAPGPAWLLAVAVAVAVAVATEALAVAGAPARRRGWRPWRTLQPHLLGGSYVALVTGLLVAATGNPVWWVLPALAGQLPIAVAERRLHGAGTAGPALQPARSTSAR